MFSRNLGASALTGAVTLAMLIAARPAAAEYLIEGLRGPVTTAEVAAFKREMQAALATKDTKDGNGPFNAFVGNRKNNYVYGLTADAVEGLLAMYEVTGDQDLLDQLIWYTDQMLLHRNDRFKKWTIFTGKVEACWPNCGWDTPSCQWYCGTEVGDVVGHIAATALLLIRHRELWQRSVPGDDPLELGRTYLERARGYIRESRVTLDGFLTPHFVHPETKRFIWPVHPNYGDGTEKSIRARGKTVPWNQNTMLANGYLNVAQALELLGEEPATVAAYDAIVKAFSDGFFAKVTTSAVMAQPVYNWSYASDDVGPDYRYDEDLGHGGYDFWGIYQAYLRGRAGIREADMLPFANTIRFVMIRPDGLATANRVNGEGPDRAGLGSTWLYGAYLRPAFYEVIAGTMLAGAKRDPMTTGRVLLAKHHASRGWQVMTPVSMPAEPDASRDGASADPAPEMSDGAVASGPATAARDAEPSPPPPRDAARESESPRGQGGATTAPRAPEPRPAGGVGGCACGTAAAASSGGNLAALLLVGVCVVRRRRECRGGRSRREQ
jgi:hypothetical protein